MKKIRILTKATSHILKTKLAFSLSLVVVAGLFGLGSGGGRYRVAIAIGSPLIAIFLIIKMIKHNKTKAWHTFTTIDHKTAVVLNNIPL